MSYTMPYYYIPPLSLRIQHFFHLRRWCFHCKDWVPAFHIHPSSDD